MWGERVGVGVQAAVARTEVGKNPDEGHGGVDQDGERGAVEGDGDRDEVEREGEPVFALGSGVYGGVVAGEAKATLDGETEDHEGDAAREQRERVEDDGEGVAIFFKDPGGEVGKKRGAEEKEQVAVEDAGVHLLNAAEEQVVIDPVDAGKGEGENIDEEDGKDGVEAGGAVFVRDLELEDHDGDDDGENAVGEGLEAGWGEGPGVGFLCHGR